MIKVNLLGQRKRKKLPTVMGVDLNTLNFKLIILAYVFGAIVESYVQGMIEDEKGLVQQNLTKLEETYKDLRAEVKKFDNTREELESFNEQVKRLRERSKQVTAIINQKTNPKPVLEQIAKTLPPDVWLESLQITNGSTIRIKGGSESYVSVGNFIMSANGTTYFENLNLANTEVQEEGEGMYSRRIETFTVEGKIRDGGAWVQ